MGSFEFSSCSFPADNHHLAPTRFDCEQSKYKARAPVVSHRYCYVRAVLAKRPYAYRRGKFRGSTTTIARHSLDTSSFRTRRVFNKHLSRRRFSGVSRNGKVLYRLVGRRGDGRRCFEGGLISIRLDFVPKTFLGEYLVMESSSPIDVSTAVGRFSKKMVPGRH